MQRRARGVVAGAFAAGMAFAMAGCAPEGAVDPSELQQFDPSQEMVEAVYGPPPEYENIPIPDNPGKAVFDPSANQNEDVYGPPPDMMDAVEGDARAYGGDEPRGSE